ncbi:30S ribosomal protein S11 [Candidatus Gracilibacteria bacterium]|nr:30S ribosomal protein S11 [Candidatus Gracilibacteria bacterium]
MGIKNTKKRVKKNIRSGRVYIYASYNNTIVTITDKKGDVITWSTAGASGFKGARQSTPYAGQVAAQNAMEKAKAFGFEDAMVYVKGIGPGREQAIRGLILGGLELNGIIDVTGIPHNGCRQKGVRRI